MQLVATPKNPVPLGAAVGFLKGKSGLKLRFARWRSALKERHGTVCIFPGRTELASIPAPGKTENSAVALRSQLGQ